MNNETTPENKPQEELKIGDLLRTEREKRGISKSRLAEDIKVREHIIEALEKEEWDKLPARVFIKGFIRSYTISIGYDTKEALRLFDKSAPSRDEDSPVPLIHRSKKNRTMYYAVPVLIILAVLVYLFTEKDKAENNIEPELAVSETSYSYTEPVQEPGISGPTGVIETAAPDKVTETNPAEPEKKVMAPDKQPQVAEKEIENKFEENSPDWDMSPQETQIEGYSSRAERPREPIEEEVLPGQETFSPESPGQVMTLTATVNERTYVKIITDDNPPKEYIFQPGTNPNWTAERGFEVTVGNAAGIELVFNGESFKNIGRAGRVKTLRFPVDFKTNWEE